jgi:sugar-phosphatase
VSTPRTFRCQAILFDLDGVLVDSQECVERTWRNWAARHRLDPARVIDAAHGRRAIDTIRALAPSLDADAELAALIATEATATEGVHEIPGARELVRALPPGRWAVVTSGTRAVAEFRLRHGRIPIPDVMICADEIERGKPDPQGYLRAAARLGVPPAKCVVVEDAPPGIDAGIAAGMKVIAIAMTYPPDALAAADAVADRMLDLRASLDGGDILVEIRARSSPQRIDSWGTGSS